MATLNDLFGNGGEKRAKVRNLKAVGEFAKGVVKQIDTDAPVFEWDNQKQGPGLQKFWVDGKPKGVAKDEAERAGLQPVHQIMVTAEDAEGEFRLSFNSKDEREGLKQAIVDAGGSIDPGDIIGKKLIRRDGNIKFHEIKVIKQDS